MRPQILIRSYFVGALLAFSSLTAAQGAFIATETSSATPIVTPASILYLYSYTVTVSASSTVSASEFDLSLGAPIDPNSIIAPSNFFSFYTPNDPFITFTAFDNGTPFIGISPGSSGTFSFTSTFAPGMGSYQSLGLDPSFTTATINGSAVSPSVVPEPASALLLGVGVCGVLAGFARSRRRGVVARG